MLAGYLLLQYAEWTVSGSYPETRQLPYFFTNQLAQDFLFYWEGKGETIQFLYHFFFFLLQ